MSWVQTPTLPACNHFLFISDLINVDIALSAGYSNLIALDIENEIILSHESAAHQDLVRPRKFLQRHAVLVIFMPKEILARVPFQLSRLA